MAEKRYLGAPFGTQTARFDVSGVHPQNKLPGTYTQIPYCKTATSKENKRLGPGTYDLKTGDFYPSAVEERARGPNWEHAHNMAKYNAIPHMYYRSQYEHNKDLVESLGPGRYETKDFITILNEKPSSKKGVCETSDLRFPRGNIFKSKIPGPGTYGKGGIPWTAVEEKAKKSFCMTGLLDSGQGHHLNMGTSGSGIAPGRYNHKNSIQEVLDKSVSVRGPYDLYTGERYVVPKLTLETVHLGPGKYEYKSFTDKLDVSVTLDEHTKKHGHLSSFPQYPELPTERIYCSTLSQWPREKTAPGPSDYELTEYGRPRTCSASVTPRHPFNSSSKRFNQRGFYRSINPVGAGQYDVSRWQRYQHQNGSTGVFISKTPRLPPKVDAPRELLLQERVHPKLISQSNKLNLDPAYALC